MAKLIGSPPGYVGHDEGGQLTAKLRYKWTGSRWGGSAHCQAQVQVNRVTMRRVSSLPSSGTSEQGHDEGGQLTAKLRYKSTESLLFYALSPRGREGCKLRFNMDLDVQSLFGLYVHSCTQYSLAETSQPPPPPPHRFWAPIRGALLFSQDIRHLFMNPWLQSEVSEWLWGVQQVWFGLVGLLRKSVRQDSHDFHQHYILKSLLSYT